MNETQERPALTRDNYVILAGMTVWHSDPWETGTLTSHVVDRVLSAPGWPSDERTLLCGERLLPASQCYALETRAVEEHHYHLSARLRRMALTGQHLSEQLERVAKRMQALSPINPSGGEECVTHGRPLA